MGDITIAKNETVWQGETALQDRGAEASRGGRHGDRERCRSRYDTSGDFVRFEVPLDLLDESGMEKMTRSFRHDGPPQRTPEEVQVTNKI